jgi:hypothetical protein
MIDEFVPMDKRGRMALGAFDSDPFSPADDDIMGRLQPATGASIYLGEFNLHLPNSLMLVSAESILACRGSGGSTSTLGEDWRIEGIIIIKFLS